MKYETPVWIVYDVRRGWIAESGDNSLPLIFDNKNEALDYAEASQFWEVHKAFIRRIS